MVKMQPDINKIKIGYFGDKDKIAEETTKLYKKEKYNAFVSLVPLIIQIVLLLGLVEVINQPLTYILDISPNEISAAKKVILQEDSSITEDSSSLELLIVKDIKNGNATKYAISTENIEKINSFNMNFLGFDMSWIAQTEGGLSLLIPLIAGLSALIMCIGQNLMNVLQQEQSKVNQWGMVALSVGLSLYLG